MCESKVYNVISFDNAVHPCNHHSDQQTENFSHLSSQKVLLYSTSYQLILSLPQRQLGFDLYHHKLVFTCYGNSCIFFYV